MILASPAFRDAAAAPHARTDVARAVLVAGGVETAYARVGTGATVLVLRAPDLADAASPLVVALAARFRVIVPGLPAGLEARDAGAFAAWLRDLLDGLGVDGAIVVAEGVLAPSALAFAQSDPLRVRRLALVVDEPIDVPPAVVRVGAFVAPASGTSIATDSAAAWADVARFLADRDDGVSAGD